MAPIYSLKERRPSGDGAPSISIAFRGEKIVRATPARRALSICAGPMGGRVPAVPARAHRGLFSVAWEDRRA